MQPFSASLLCHPARTCDFVESLTVRASLQDGLLCCEYIVRGKLDRIQLPASKAPQRRDELWKKTCFEIFLRKNASDESCVEFNFAPSGEWAAYIFSGYRQDGRDFECSPPQISYKSSDDCLMVSASVALPAILLPISGAKLGVSAVLEDADHTLLYWALKHPGPAPDFHHPDNFIQMMD